MFPPSTRVLVVDDLQTIRIMLIDILNRLGLKYCEEAPDGETALKKMEEAQQEGSPFGLIVCDWNMPEMSGIDLLERKSTHDSLKNIPFLMVTIESEKDNVLQALQKGAHDFVVKPFTEEIIRKKLESIWDRMNG